MLVELNINGALAILKSLPAAKAPYRPEYSANVVAFGVATLVTFNIDCRVCSAESRAYGMPSFSESTSCTGSAREACSYVSSVDAEGAQLLNATTKSAVRGIQLRTVFAVLFIGSPSYKHSGLEAIFSNKPFNL
ncbi:hypothetical protein D3C87_1819270 [compost metagenome]